MRCRQCYKFKNDDGTEIVQIVRFGRVFGNPLLCSDKTIASDETLVGSNFIRGLDNYVDRQDAVVSSLTQRFSIIRGELWYAINTGLPLFDNVTSKSIIDAYVVKTISGHPDVRSITYFDSKLEKNEYTASCKILTIFGELMLSL